MTLADVGAGSLDDVLADLRWRFAGRDTCPFEPGQWQFLSGDSSALLVTEGLIRIEGLDEAEDLTPGDFLFVPRVDRFAVNALSEARVLRIQLTPAATGTAMDALPPRVLLTGFTRHAPLAATMLRHLVEECADRDGVQGDRVATLIASMAIESWHDRGCAPKQWLLRVNEPDIARAVAAVHADPGRDWTVEALARVALASRSGFAARFQKARGSRRGATSRHCASSGHSAISASRTSRLRRLPGSSATARKPHSGAPSAGIRAAPPHSGGVRPAYPRSSRATGAPGSAKLGVRSRRSPPPRRRCRRSRPCRYRPHPGHRSRSRG